MLNNQILALCELSNDLLYSKIPVDKLSYYINSSLEAGKTTAKEYQGKDIRELYEENQIQIEYCKENKSTFGVVLRGQMVMGKEDAKVELYLASIESLAKNSQIYDLPPLDYNMALQIHLAHEFFHFLEYKHKKVVSEALDSVVIMKLFGLRRKGHINRCSEIAAHTFAKELLQLPYLPNLYDYAYLINTGKMTQAGFSDFLCKMEQNLSASYC